MKENDWVEFGYAEPLGPMPEDGYPIHDVPGAGSTEDVGRVRVHWLQLTIMYQVCRGWGYSRRAALWRAIKSVMSYV